MSRPTPEEVRKIVAQLARSGHLRLALPVLVGCSRATAYRAIADALATGAVKRAPP